MKLPTLLGKHSLSLRALTKREIVLPLALLLLLLFTIGLLAWDGYQFYLARLAGATEAAPASKSSGAVLREDDITQLIRLLDDRARQSDALLSPHSVPVATTTATTTPAQ